MSRPAPGADASNQQTAKPRKRTASVDVERALIEAATSLLDEGGADAVTVRAVADRAGVAPMGVYSRFDGKHGLLEALFIQAFDQLHASLTSLTGTTPAERMRNSGVAYRQFALSRPQAYRLMFDHMQEITPSDEALEHAEAAFTDLVTLCAACVDSGAFAARPEVEIAQQVWGAIHGAVMLEIACVCFTDDVARSYEDLLDTLMRGFSA